VFTAKGAGLFHEHRVMVRMRHFRRSYLKGNKVGLSKREETRKVEHAHYF